MGNHTVGRCYGTFMLVCVIKMESAERGLRYGNATYSVSMGLKSVNAVIRVNAEKHACSSHLV